jgi:hypothetical protein
MMKDRKTDGVSCSAPASAKLHGLPALDCAAWSIPDCVRTDLQTVLVVAIATALPVHAIPRKSQARPAISPRETGIDEREKSNEEGPRCP